MSVVTEPNQSLLFAVVKHHCSDGDTPRYLNPESKQTSNTKNTLLLFTCFVVALYKHSLNFVKKKNKLYKLNSNRLDVQFRYR